MKRFMASVTVWKRGGVGALEWDGLVKFLHEKGDADPDFKAFFAVEKGPREGGLHLQGVLDIKTTSAVKISGMLRQALKDPECTDKIRETKVMCKSLTGRHLHTFHGMLGYCQKDIGKPHYKFHLINVEQADLDEGMHQYTLYGAGDIKHKTALEPKTLLSKIEMWYRYKCCSDRNIDVITILRDMLRSGLFYPTMWWIMPTGGAGLSQERLQIMFDIMRDWEATTRSDVRAIFMAPDVRYSDMHMELAEQTSVVNLRDWQKELVDATHAEPHARAVMWWWSVIYYFICMGNYTDDVFCFQGACRERREDLPRSPPDVPPRRRSRSDDEEGRHAPRPVQVHHGQDPHRHLRPCPHHR